MKRAARTPPLPTDLGNAYDWIDAAGEWNEALRDPSAYAAAAVANYRQTFEDNADPITEDEIKAAIEWRRRYKEALS